MGQTPPRNRSRHTAPAWWGASFAGGSRASREIDRRMRRRDESRVNGGLQSLGLARSARPPIERSTRFVASWVCFQKKVVRPAEQDRPDVQQKRARFIRRLKRIDPDRLVFLDEAAANLAMGRSHAWIRRGEVKIHPKPMNWGRHSLTMLGALRLKGWITMSTIFGSANRDRFVAWIRRRLVPKLHRDDIVILDNAAAHHDPRVIALIEARGATVEFLPPYSPDLNPIEPGWAIAKKHIRAVAPRDHRTLRKAAHAGRRRVGKRHCEAWFRHSGYQRRLN